MKRPMQITVALLPMMFWGMSFVWTKIVYQYYGPTTTVTVRLIIATILLSLFIRLTGKRETIRPEDRKLFFVVALLQPFCYFLGESYGVKYVSATLASVTIATIPVVTPVFAALLLGERMSRTNIAGLLLSFIGVTVMVVSPTLEIDASPLGMIALGFAVLSAVGYGLLIKRISEKYSSLTIVNLQNIIGILFFLPVMFLTEGTEIFEIVPTWELVRTILLLAVLCSAVAFILLTITIREIGVSRANIYTNTIPVFTAVFAWLVIGETLSLRQVVGMFIVLGGLLLSQITRKKPRTREMLYVEG